MEGATSVGDWYGGCRKWTLLVGKPMGRVQAKPGSKANTSLSRN